MLSLLDEGPRCSTAISVDKTILLQVSKDSLRELLQRHPHMAIKILFRVGTWLREADEQIKTMGLYDIYGRIAYGLMKFHKQDVLNSDGRFIIKPKPTIQELADRIGSSRETVSRAIKVLKDNGYLKDLGHSYVLEQRMLSLYPLLIKDFKTACSSLAS